jgi:hypothetical protein
MAKGSRGEGGGTTLLRLLFSLNVEFVKQKFEIFNTIATPDGILTAIIRYFIRISSLSHQEYSNKWLWCNKIFIKEITNSLAILYNYKTD